ncbi:hypothetical protein RRG08_007054 [Elysia crispata]|uniref:Uncharacterized protein n=1 Tax=Elysia crispata TaxID=231223 RepID=A0AAE1DHY7_9GAST|nr:hypothetical protein RRG08_007054 [Elysia crispata]
MSFFFLVGRNVALKQRIFYRGPDSTAGLDPGSALASASSVVDGITWPVSAGSCLPFSARPDHSELYLVLDSALDLTSIHFYLVNASDSKCCNDVEDSFGLTFFGSKFLELDAKFTVKSHSDEPQLKFFLHEMPLVYMIVVENLKQSNSLYICEIEVYGECPRGKFGSQCGSNCNCESNSSCSLMGQCDGECPPGFQGDGCTSKCDNRTFGPDCKLPCSPFCKERRCDRVNGTCTKGCDHDFEPPYCLKAKKDERKAQRGEMEYPLEQDDLTTTIVAAGLVSTLLFIFVLSCNVYLAITSAPRDMSISVSSTSSSIDQNFQFLTYYDVKRGELRKKPSWGSNICDAGEDEDMRNVALTSSMAINSQAGVRHFWRETTV